ncbi:anti-sigma factor [Rhodococcus sp. SGAir0479]|uniref:anti-sigma factor n=1 Tax=Rhodococcus sp. SGAir0479 TaxID=2567884 RepID=UPI0010CCE526|nr:anti-sigma factor [Rhodococcus sp. SGAir0479]QCQ89870.1 anti-sigma factor [Rhodococcus sp. SGAir0479]
MQAGSHPELSPRPADHAPPVTLTVAARHDQLSVVRMLTELVAMRNNCTLDQSADLKLAVDQISTLMISAAADDTELSCRYLMLDETFQVVLEAITVADWHPEEGSLEWRILSALADSISVTQQPDDTGRTASTATICMRKLV